MYYFFFFQAEDGIRDLYVTGVQTCALPIFPVRDRDSGGRDLRAGALRRAPGGRVLRAHPADVPAFLGCHSASWRLTGRTPYFANAVLCERRTRTIILLCEHCLRRAGGTMAAPATKETRYARNGEVRIAFEDLGGARGEPLLLIMGLAVSRFWWPQGLVDELVRRGFHVVAYDQRDAGQSTHFPDTGAASPIAAVLRRRSPAYTAEDMTHDAVAVLDALGWDSAHLFGHSMGGQLAQRIALRHPGRVRSITSSASLPGDVGRLGAARYVRVGTLARLARMK